MLRKLLSLVMIAVLPGALLAADSAGAMLYAKGTAWLNGSTVPRSSAVFPGDLIQTKANSVANINAAGSNVLIVADSLVKFEGTAFSVEHGSVSVGTSKKVSTRAREVKVEPVSDSCRASKPRASSQQKRIRRRRKGARSPLPAAAFWIQKPCYMAALEQRAC